MCEVGGAMQTAWNLRSIGILYCLTAAISMTGCMAQQADLKQTERKLQRKIKQSNEELAQTRARQSQEISTLREQELPQLRDQLERAQHQAKELQQRQDDIKQRSAMLKQQMSKLEQLAAKIEADSATFDAKVRESLNVQESKNKEERDRLGGEVNNRLDEMNRQMDLLRKDIIDAVQKTISALAKSIDVKFNETNREFDSVIGTILLRVEELEKRFQALKK